MLEFKEEVIEFKFNGEKHQIKKPNNGEIKDYNKSLQKVKGDAEKEEKVLLDFLEKLGLSKKIFNLLNPSQSQMLLEKLYESEKN